MNLADRWLRWGKGVPHAAWASGSWSYGITVTDTPGTIDSPGTTARVETTVNEILLSSTLSPGLEILRLEAAEKEMKQALKGWVQKQGPVLVQDQQWDLWPSMSWQFGPDQLKNMARAVAERGENPWQFFGLSSADLNKLQEKIGWTDKDLKTMGGKEKVTKSFRAKKVDKKKVEQAASNLKNYYWWFFEEATS